MSQNSYIVSGGGFLKEIFFDMDNKVFVPKWTNRVREAKAYSYKSACVLIKKHNLNAFVWNPFAEEPVRNKWRVVRRRDYGCFVDGKTHEALEWKAERVVMNNKTDAKFLISRNSTPETLYDSLEEATVVANEKNEVMIKELQEKMNLMSEWARKAK